MSIAVIGAGISGLGAALALSDTHDVTLFERDARFGGHANTVEIDYDGASIAVDTGFIVFNRKNYPNLCGLFDHLGVASETSDMSFGVSLDAGRLEYGCAGLDTVFAQRWRALDPVHWASFADARRFMRIAPKALADGELDGVSLGEFLDRRRFGRAFRDRFLLPMGGAIWSTSVARMNDFPARCFVQFFANHELLRGFGEFITWRTVSGGSREYVRKALRKLGPRAHAGVGAEQVRRRRDGRVEVAFSDGSQGVFNQVVLACHADQSLALLADADPAERAMLSSVRFSNNVAVLHRDPALMPHRRKVWSSWNFLADSARPDRPAAVSYWMNRLQNLDPNRPLFVTLNPPQETDPALTFGRFDYAHPLFDAQAFDAQAAAPAVQGRRGVWFAGAWLGWGFHEDGLVSGLKVAQALGARPAWAAQAETLRAPLSIAAE